MATHDERWKKKFAALRAFQKKHGHCNVPCRSGKLGFWVSHQRAQYAFGELSAVRIAQLESIGINWNPYDQAWETQFAALCAYKETHGHCIVPSHEGTLGFWVSTQRTHYNSGQLSKTRIAQLNAIDFCWSPFDAAWETQFAALCAYKETHGHCNVPSNQGNLAFWVKTQRKDYKNGTISETRTVKLESIGFCWSVHDAAWERQYAALCAFKKKHGHCNVPQSHAVLGLWVKTQRVAYKRGKLLQKRQAKLESIGFTLT